MSNKEAFDRAHPNTLPDHFREVGIGTLLAGGLIHRSKFSFVAGGTSARHVATLQHMALQSSSKAMSILRATVRAGAVTGELTPQAFGATPATTQIAVAPNGDIVALAADAITDVDVTYLSAPMKELVLTLDVDPATGICLLPPPATGPGVVYLVAAEALVGTVSGEKRVLVPGAVNPATPQARLSVAKTQVNFTVADAVSKAKITLAINVPNLYSKLYEAEVTV